MDLESSMLRPKEGFNSGVDLIVSGSVMSNGDFVSGDREGPGTIASNREIATLSTRQDATWTEAENITAITIVVISETAEVSQEQAVIGVCFDAPDDATAVLMLTQASHTTDASEMVLVGTNQPRTYYFTAPLRRLDAIRLYGGEALRVLVEAN